MSQIIAKVDGLKKKYYEDQVKKAKDIDSIKDAYETYLDAAGANGWDTDDVNNAYADRRLDLMNTLVADSSKSSEQKVSAIREMASDLHDLDLFNEKKDKLGAAYFNLASQVREDAGTDIAKLGRAEKFFTESLQYGDANQKVKVEEEIAKMYNSAADQCIADAKEKGKGFNNCPALAKKANKAMNDTIKAQSRIKGDDSLEALAGMKQEKIARFGGGQSMTMQVRGYDGSSINVNRMGGSFDASMYTGYAATQQQFVTNMMMRQSMGASGMQQAGGGSSGSFFQ